MHEQTTTSISQSSGTLLAVSEDGVRIAYEDIGAGQPLVLLHGMTETRRSWREAGYVDRLLRQGKRLLLIDCRGHGESGKPHEPQAYSDSKSAADVVAVLDQAGIERAALMGFSMGGRIALGTAMHHPQRVATLIVVGAHPFAEELTPYRMAVRDGFEKWIKSLEGQTPRLSAAVRRRIRANDLAAIQAYVAQDWPDASAALAGLSIPVLAISGTLDSRHEDVRRLAELTGGQFLALPDKNHITSFSDAQEKIVTAVIEFLSRITA